MEETLAHAGGMDDLVQLDKDHPGFRDPSYRARRNEIAQLALDYREGDPVPEIEYTSDEHEVWREVWNHLEPLHGRYACREYIQCSEALSLSRDEIPQLRDVNRALLSATGFRMLPVAGLVSVRTFLSYLGRGIFLSTQYMRHHSRPLYTPEPDVVHELVGHAATLADPELAELNRLFGRVAAACNEETVERIGRVYWFTLEFGAAYEEDADGVSRAKAYGAGLLSSAGEIARLDSKTDLLPFDVERLANTPYDPTDFQPHYFTAPSFARMIADVTKWLTAC